MIGACISANFGLKRMADSWNADGGVDNFYKIDGSKRGFLKIAVDAIECFSINESSCHFELANGNCVVLEFNGKNEMNSWISKEKSNITKLEMKVSI